jgi:LysM repeat protein
MRNILSRAVTPALAVIAISAALTAAARPILAVPAAPSSPLIVTTAKLSPALTPAVVALTARRHPPIVIPPPRTWTVTAGGTLSEISQSVYGTSDAWYYLQQANHLASATISPGETLRLPAPRASYPAPPPVVTTTAAGVQQRSAAPPASSGTYSYSGLEALWEANGGSSGVAATAACIAEHESSGKPAAFNGTDIGLFQIDPGNEPGADLYDAGVNAAEAVRLSVDGTNWSDWQTAPDCGV